MAQAVKELWPDAKLGIGPSIEDGFYYDFEFKNPISDKDLPKIEKKMRETLKDWQRFEAREAGAADAREFFKNNPDYNFITINGEQEIEKVHGDILKKVFDN